MGELANIVKKKNLDPSKPDYEIEMFWYGLKSAMYNMYYDNNLISVRPIDYWSDILNDLQKKEKYELIEKNIRNYLSLFGIDIMKFASAYHTNIFVTNIKRWNEIGNKYNFQNNSDNYYNIVFVLVDCYKVFINTNIDIKDIRRLFGEIELFIIYENFIPLIKFAVKFNKDSIINKLNSYTNIIEQISSHYNIEIPQMKGSKLIRFLKNLK